jgi:TolB-like protein
LRPRRRERFALNRGHFTRSRIGRKIGENGGTRNMSLRGVLAELRHRGVLKVAAAYAAIGWVALQGLSLLFQSFDAPGWVIKVVTTLVILGFPVACLMSWGFDITPEGVRPIPPAPKEPGPLPTTGLQIAPVVEASASPSIAVLPFVDMSAEHDQQYLGDGIAEELLNALASIEGLNVAARTSSFSFHGKSVTMSEIGDTLHVRHVLEGSVRRAGQRLRITAQLIDVKNGFHLFTQSYDRELRDIFAIQNDIAREIAGALLPKLGLGEDVMLVRQGTTNLEAYGLWLKGHQWLTTPIPSTAPAAIDQLRQAVALDPRYADAWGALAYVYAYSGNWASDPTPLLVNGTDAAAVARALAPGGVLPLLHQAYISLLVHRDAAASAAYYEQSRAAGIDLSVWAYNKAYLLDGPLGRFDRAITVLNEAERRDPLAPSLKWALMEMYLASNRIADAVAIADAQRGSSLPDMNVAAGLAYVAAGNIARARECLASVRAITDDYYAEGMLLHFAIDDVTSDRDDARQLLDLALRWAAQCHDVSPYLIGEGYKARGDYDSAIDVWSRAADMRVPWTVSLMPLRNRNHPVIGKDQRFLALLKRMGLEGDGETKAAGQ